jgi:hypothetical protein
MDLQRLSGGNGRLLNGSGSAMNGTGSADNEEEEEESAVEQIRRILGSQLDTLVWIDRQSGYLLPIFTILSILLA